MAGRQALLGHRKLWMHQTGLKGRSVEHYALLSFFGVEHRFSDQPNALEEARLLERERAENASRAEGGD